MLFRSSNPQKPRRLKAGASSFRHLFRPRLTSRVRGLNKRKLLRGRRCPSRKQMISRASAHRPTQFGNKLCVPRTRRAQRLFCGKFLDRHAVFNRRISFSKGSDGLNQNPPPVVGCRSWLHEKKGSTCLAPKARGVHSSLGQRLGIRFQRLSRMQSMSCGDAPGCFDTAPLALNTYGMW